MRRILCVAGPVVCNFVAWALITKLPVHSLIIFGLAVMAGVLMLYAMVHFGEKKGKISSTQSQS